MTITEQYRATASQATTTVEKIIDFWTQGARTLSSQGFTIFTENDLSEEETSGTYITWVN